ncbi:MAG: beta-propeller domain-containing protein [Clostridia bacterium]|nr:beta-propeller domain-containing protein [Clostridia bacterium]
MKQYDEMMNELHEKFNEAPEMPESLSKESIVNKIKLSNTKPKEKKTFAFKSEALAAAVTIIIIGAIVIAQNGFGNSVTVKDDLYGQQEQATDITITTAAVQNRPATDTELPSGIYTFDGNESLKEHFLSLYHEKGGLFGSYYTYDLTGGLADGVTMAVTQAPSAFVSEEDSAEGFVVNKSSQEYGTTNVQTEGVDEGDIIKNDGRYIYIISGSYKYESRLKIIDTQTMQLSYNGKIQTERNTQATVKEIYVNGDTLTVIYTSDGNNDTATETLDTVTYVDIYDISDRTDPKKITGISQDGYFRSSRMTGTVLYTLSTYYVIAENEEDVEKHAVPMINGKSLDGACVYHFDDDSATYTVITALDTSSRNGESTSLAVLGDLNDIYCSESTLYTLCTKLGTDPGDETIKTEITSFSLNGLNIKCMAKGEVPGSFNNSYSFDEYNGYLRAATTRYDSTSYKDVSSIYVLDKDLKIVGSCENLGDDEQIKSVRFMGNKGYIVTFRQTDPLFSLDLSDPTNPKVTGELKLPGYSTYLHPLSDNCLLGIGYGGDEESADTNNLKIALFDISDMTKPVLLDDFIIECASSEVNYEPKALIHYKEKNIIGIPVTDYNNYGSAGLNAVKSFAIISYTKNELSQITGFVHNTTGSTEFFRGTYIGDSLYTVDEFKVIEHSLSTGEKTRECPIMQEGEEKEAVTFETSTVPAVEPANDGFFANMF